MKYTYMVLLVIGLWRPIHWRPGWKTNLYNSYGWFLLFVMMIGITSQFIAWMMSIDDIEEFASNSFTLLTMMLDYGKGLNILIKRAEIIELTDGLKRYPCAPKSEKEFAIQREFDRSVRSVENQYELIGHRPGVKFGEINICVLFKDSLLWSMVHWCPVASQSLH